MLGEVALPEGYHSSTGKERSFCKWMIYEVTFPGQQVSPECLRVKSHDFLVKNTGNVGWVKLTWWADSFALINELITRRCQLTKPSIFSIVEFRECSRREGHPCWTCLRIATGSWPAKQFCLTSRAFCCADILCYFSPVLLLIKDRKLKVYSKAWLCSVSWDCCWIAICRSGHILLPA